MKQNSYLIPRRSFLKGTGVAMALPVLDIMSPALCYGAKSKQEKNLRLCVLYKGCGVIPHHWDIVGGTETNFEMSKLLTPLKNKKKDLLILRNLDHSIGKTNGGHEDAPLLFTTGGRHKSRYKQSYSFDQMVADEIGNKTPIKSLQLTADNIWKEHPWLNNLSHTKDGSPMPAQRDPEIVFNMLFKGLNNKKYRDDTGSILDKIKDSSSILTKKASHADRLVIDQYFSSIRDVEKRINQMKDAQNPARQKMLSKVKPIDAVSDLPGRIKSMLNLMAIAFCTDTTRVATFMMANTNSRCTYVLYGSSRRVSLSVTFCEK